MSSTVVEVIIRAFSPETNYASVGHSISEPQNTTAHDGIHEVKDRGGEGSSFDPGLH